MDLEPGGSRRTRRARPAVGSYVESPESDDISSGDEYSEGDETHEKEEDLSSREVFDKYRHSASVITKSLKKLIPECKAGKKIADLCKLGDEYMDTECHNFHNKNKYKHTPAGISLPTCISVNHRICFVSPSTSDDTILEQDDTIKIEMSFDTDGCIASLVHTHLLNENMTGRTGEVLAAAGAARAEVLKVMKHTITKNELRESSVSLLMDSYRCKLLKFECQSLERSSLESMSDDDAFKLNKAYTVDMIIGTDDTKFEEEDSADVFTIMPLKEIKAASVPMIFLTIDKEFQQRAFSIRSLEGRKDPDLAAFISSRKSQFLKPYPILRTTDGMPVVRLKFTIFLTKEGPQDRTSIRLQKFSHKKGEKEPVMYYCGKLPIGSNAMGNVPSVNSISWALGKKKEKQKKLIGEQKIACTGPCGTYVFVRTMGNLNKAKVEDLEIGWTKKEISGLHGLICACCPYEDSTLAVGATDQYDRANIYLLHLSVQNQNPTPIFESTIGLGINSLSWSQNGLHLLCTFNDAKSFVVITRSRNKLIRTGFHAVQFAYPKKAKCNHFGVFHPSLLIVFITTSTAGLGVFLYDDKQASSRPDYYKKYGSSLGDGRGFSGVATSASGEFLICPRVNGSILGLKFNCVKMACNMSPIFDVLFDQHFDAPTPFDSLKCSTLSTMDLFAIRDKGQTIRTYEYSEKPAVICDNKKDIDCMNAHHDFTTMSELKQLIALGGKDGFLHFWLISADDVIPFAVKMRNFLSERLFYTKRQLLLGSGESLRQKRTEVQTKFQEVADAIQSKMLTLGSMMNALGDESADRVDLLEQRIQKALDIGSDMLSRRLPQSEGSSLSVLEVRGMLEELLEVLTTVDD